MLILKSFGSLLQNYRDEPDLDNNNIIIDFLLITITVCHSNSKSK